MEQKEIVIIGAGGFGREVQWLIERINQNNPTWKILGYLDDGVAPGTEVNGYKVLGGVEVLEQINPRPAAVCAIGSAGVREKVIARVKNIGEIEFPNLIDPDVQMSSFITMGEGNIICAGNILTVNISIEDFDIINLSCTIGHDVVLGSFVTVYPGVNISGCIKLGKGVELGTGSQIIQGKNICEDTIIGAGAVVVKDIEKTGTYVGVPVKKIGK